jgi:poly(A) polymerase
MLILNTGKIQLQDEIFRFISDEAGKAGLKAFVVGGYVRDILLKRSSKDIDILVVGNGVEFATSVAQRLGSTSKLSVFKNFGTANLKSGEFEIEFVGARKESYRSDSRKPLVEEGTLEDDLSRRDFTINALAVSLNQENFGDLIDNFDGFYDLEHKIIRTPLNPDITFSDDPLRMMRAIRFATQLSFSLYSQTFESIARNADRIKIISQERITDELNKIIPAPVPSAGFKLLHDSGLLKIIFPELMALKGAETVQNQTHKDNFYHTLQVLDNVAAMSNDLWLRWAAILHDIGKPASKRFDPKI